MAEVENYYTNLYKLELLNPSANLLHSFLGNSGIPKLSDEEATLCEGKLTASECFKSLQSFQKNKSPGNDGLTVEFYIAFWDVVGDLLVDSLNCSYDYGELSNSQKQAIITLLEKKDKDKTKISNWRPISLINVDAKIGSKAIALRLQTILPSIIHYNQSAYVKGRTVFDAIRTIDDVLEYTERYKIDGRMVAIDFQKAFDSVNRNFLYETLFTFGFGPSFIQWVCTFYQNISSCVVNNGFATGHFPIQRGVRQGDPLSPYLFIIVLEVLATGIRGDASIRGVNVDGIDIKLQIFADDLTGFVRNEQSFNRFLDIIEEFGECSGLRINYDKTEILFLGNQLPKHVNDGTEIRKAKVKRAVKILGVHFTYDVALKQKLNFDEIMHSIKENLKLWRWRNLTVIGRIQIVKTFVIPIIMYRAGLISLDKEVIKEANSIIYDFIWKGKDKVKRSSLINDLEHGGLKAPHLESIIKTQRIMCCKRFANDQLSAWKAFLLHYLKPIGGKFILCCDFDLKKLPITLPKYYIECFECFVGCSGAKQKNDSPSHEDISQTVIWNNRFICIDSKSVYNKHLVSKGIIRISDLILEENQFITTGNLNESDLSPLDVFGIIAIIDAIPCKWREILKTKSIADKSDFVLQDEIYLRLLDIRTPISKAISKGVYADLKSKVLTTPTAQQRYTDLFSEHSLEWKEIYSLPFKVALDTKSREFQYKILHRFLTTNILLKKMGKVDSSKCSFCGTVDESLEHLFVSCPIIKTFWNDLICWCRAINIQIDSLCALDILFGLWKRKDDFLLLNHVIIIAKQYIYYCRNNVFKSVLLCSFIKTRFSL